MGQKVPGPPRKYSPLKNSPPPKISKKNLLPKNIPLLNSAAPVISEGFIPRHLRDWTEPGKCYFINNCMITYTETLLITIYTEIG